MATGIEEVLQQQEDSTDETTPETAEAETNTEEVVEETKPEEATKETAETDAETTEEPVTTPPDIAPETDELNELRQFIREQRREIAAMKAKLSRMQDVGETDDEGNTVVKYSPLEQLQIELHNVAQARQPFLEVMAEAMEANPKYTDIYDVCTKRNFDDIFEMAATSISRQERRDYNEVLLQLELETWKKPNPYKYMYSIIKENHPKYKDKAIEKVIEKEKPKSLNLDEALKQKTAAKILEAKKVPGSVAAAGAGENLGSGGWTSAKIDALSEMELHTVPKDIYQKYMMGKLK